MTASNAFGRQVVVALTNKSGGAVAAGDVVYLNDGTNADSFTTGTTSARTGGIGIAQETISNNAAGRILIGGYASLVNVNASVTIGHYGQTYTVAKQATDAGATRAAGTFCQFQTGGTTPDAIIWQPDLGGGSGMTNPMTTTGDMIYSSSGSTPARLAAVAAGQVLKSAGTSTAPAWGYAPFHGCKAYSDTTQSINSATMTAATLNQEEYDTDSFHDNVTNNTRMTIPTGMGGYYRLTGYALSASTSGSCIIQFFKNGTTTLRSQAIVPAGANGAGLINTTVTNLSAADYVEMRVYHTAAGASNIGDAVNVEQQTFFSIELIGV